LLLLNYNYEILRNSQVKNDCNRCKEGRIHQVNHVTAGGEEEQPPTIENALTLQKEIEVEKQMGINSNTMIAHKRK